MQPEMVFTFIRDLVTNSVYACDNSFFRLTYGTPSTA